MQIRKIGCFRNRQNISFVKNKLLYEKKVNYKKIYREIFVILMTRCYTLIIMIICDKNKLDGKRYNAAPDFVIEIVSPGNPADDYIRKLYYYKNTNYFA